MLAKFIFNLPEESEEYERYLKGPRAIGVLIGLRATLRDLLKYGELTKDERVVYSKISEDLWKMVKEEGLEELV